MPIGVIVLIVVCILEWITTPKGGYPPPDLQLIKRNEMIAKYGTSKNNLNRGQMGYD